MGREKGRRAVMRLDRCIPLSLCAVVVTLGGAAPAGAATPVRIVSPVDEGVVTQGKARIVVRARPSGRFRAELNGRGITQRFRTSGSRTRTAVVPKGRLRPNHNHLRIRSGKGFDSAKFDYAPRRGRLIRSRLPARTSAAGKAGLRYKLAKPRSTVLVFVNGQLAHRSPPWEGRVRKISLDGDHGLKPGDNKVRLVAFKARRHQVQSGTVHLRASRPIPAAGPGGSAGPGTIPLSARHSRATAGGSLGYQWEIVRAPEGSAPTVTGANSPRARLRTTVSGVYRVRLEVTETKAGGKATGAAKPGTTSDVVETAVTPQDNIGAPIESIALNGSGQKGILIGGDPQGNYPQQFYPATDQSAELQLLVLDRQTLEFVSNDSYGADAGGTSQLLAHVQSVPNSQLAILTTPQNAQTPTLSGQSLANVNAAMNLLGGDPAPTYPSAGCVRLCPSFTVIGTTGITDDQGKPQCCPSAENWGLSLAVPGRQPSLPGSLHGYLQEDLHGNYRYVSGDFVRFDTVGQGASSTQAVIEIGDCDLPQAQRIQPCSQHTSQQIPQGQGGYFVLILDAGTLAIADEGTFSGPGFAGDVVNILKDRANGDLAFIQSIGDAPYDPAISAPLMDLGGSPYLYQTIANAGPFTQVGPDAGPSSPFTEVSTPAMSPSGGKVGGQLVGLLGRNNHGTYYPVNSGPSDTLDFEFPRVVYGPQTAWPYRGAQGSSGQEAVDCAYRYLQSRSAGEQLAGPTLEGNYVTTGPGWGALGDALQDLSYSDLSRVKNCEASRFTEDFWTKEVQPQIAAELGGVGAIQGWNGKLVQPFESQNNTYVSVEAIANEILGIIDPPPKAVTSVDGVAVASDVFWLVGAVAGTFGCEGCEGLTNIVSASLSLANDAQSNTTGGGDSVARTFETTADNVANELGEAYQNSNLVIEQFGDFLVGDWRKISETVDRIKTGGSWEWLGAPSASAIDSALTASTERQAYHALTPLYLDAWHVTDTSSELNGYECRTDSAERPNQTATFSAPFAELDSLGQFPTGAGTFGLLRPGLINSSFWGEAPGGRPRTTYDTNQTGSYSGVPNTDLLRPMFRPTSNHPQMGAVDFPSLLAYGYNAYGELWQPNTVSKFNALNGTGFCQVSPESG